MINGFNPATTGDLPPKMREKVQRRDNVLGPGYRLFYEEPVEIVRGRGAHLFDADGVDYLDVYNNVPAVGHCHPRVVEAVSRQAATLNTNTRYVQDSLAAYSERLLATFPPELDRVTFACTGSEANDLAMRVARYATGQEGVIVTSNAYHGLTAQIAAMSPSLGAGSPLGPHVRVIDPPDALRFGEDDIASHMRTQVRAAVADLQRHGFGIAAFIADSIFSSDGIFADPRGVLAPIIEEIHSVGGLYIADEVQPGFVRTGDNWWGFQRHGIVPDIVTLGKPMGNGIPISAAVFRGGVTEEFGANIRYFNTFGGNSVSIAAAAAVLDVIEDEQLAAHSRAVGELLRSGLQDLLGGSDRVAEVRGAGLFIGVDLVVGGGSLVPDGELAARIVNEMRARHVLISASGAEGNVLKVRPPMAFDRADADRFLTTVADVGNLVL
ncbi:aspartate aminotransferase family protein [Mycobacterium sp. MS1601]|uniref:aspartate aminotransferase family protein n=1 Tax=Mycobacterium sp. MS1601 TaxID=1936029 RepID=UPI0009797F41|nr:aspartate aminotransferase family protein [Mycobacterium sp. MS1601]